MNRRLLAAGLTALVLTFAWNTPFILPIKLLVVYVHEFSHALVALLLGANLEQINVNAAEWGETVVRNLHSPLGFTLVVVAGYLGSALIGNLLLNRGLQANWDRPTTFFLAMLLLYSGYLFTTPGSLTFFTAIGWGFFFLSASVLPREILHYIMVITGVFFIWYCFHDMYDFSEQMEATDAGILANWLLNESELVSRYASFSFITGSFATLMTGAISMITLAGLVQVVKSNHSHVAEPDAANTASSQEATNEPSKVVVNPLAEGNLVPDNVPFGQREYSLALDSSGDLIRKTA
ncbi:MAG: M50 family metallopeptidase [Leptospiraceae bacterium]|nr:M50 family metallopeptidase [Leptospiraceae bacterium]